MRRTFTIKLYNYLLSRSFLFLCVLVFFFQVLQAQTDNTVLGTGAGVSITSGDYNVIIGDSAGTNLSTGSGNVFIGEDAGFHQTTAGRASQFNPRTGNVFIGIEAGYNNVIGIDLIAIGSEAGFSMTGGVGASSGGTNSTRMIVVADSSG